MKILILYLLGALMTAIIVSYDFLKSAAIFVWFRLVFRSRRKEKLLEAQTLYEYIQASDGLCPSAAQHTEDRIVHICYHYGIPFEKISPGLTVTKISIVRSDSVKKWAGRQEDLKHALGKPLPYSV